MQRFLPSITTIGLTSSSWRDKIAEVQALNLSEVALFLTCLGLGGRRECYRQLRQLRKVHQFTIPFVHAKAEMSEEEYKILIEEFGSERFNIHPVREFPLSFKLSSKIRERIYIENSTYDRPLALRDLDGFAGVCLDLSHLDDLRKTSTEEYLKFAEILETSVIGANHISAVKSNPTHFSREGQALFADHVCDAPSELSYLSLYPRSYFSDLCAIELENSLAEQLQFVPVVREEIAKGLAGNPQKIAA